MQLAESVGVNHVEIRNDIEGQELFDGTAADEVRETLAERGLRVASLNALQQFNRWNDERAGQARTLASWTRQLGAAGIVLCPLIDAAAPWNEAEKVRQLIDGLRALRPILQDAGITGYVEPLGMPGSTLKSQRMAVEAIGEIDGWDTYALCYDTFQYYRCGDDRIWPEHVGLVHVSGITRTDLSPEALTEPDRGFVFADDRVGNVEQLLALKAAGYHGVISMEPFSPATQADPAIAERLAESLAYLRSVIGSD